MKAFEPVMPNFVPEGQIVRENRTINPSTYGVSVFSEVTWHHFEVAYLIFAPPPCSLGAAKIYGALNRIKSTF